MSSSPIQSPSHEGSQLVIKMAHLARLKLEPHEVELFGTQLQTILGYIDQLKTVDVSGVEPLISPVFSKEAPRLPSRRDEVLDEKSGMSDRMLSCAPDSRDHAFGVPPVL